MLNLSQFRKNVNGCTVVVTEERNVRFAHVQPIRAGKSRVVSYGEKRIDEGAKSLAAALKGFGLSGIRNGAMLLGAGAYQFLVVDAPDVPEAELKSAMKWRLKDIVGFPVEEAVFDLLMIPGPGGAAFRTRSLFAVVARSESLRRRVANFDAARFGLAVIDVPETAQRNIAALYEEEGRGVVWLFFDETGGLMTISFGGELYHARRFEITSRNVADASGEGRKELFNHLLLELQRTFDNFERQFSFIPLTKVMVGPEPDDTGLAAFLRANLAVPVEDVALGNVLDFPSGAVPGKRDQWRFFHLFGCALRNGATAQ